MFKLNVNNIENIRDSKAFVSFLQAMAADFQSDRAHWENTSVDGYLEAIAAWLSDQDESLDAHEIDWHMLAKLMYAGKIYE